MITTYIQQGHWIAALSIMSFSCFAGWSIGLAVKTLMKVIFVIAGLIIAAIITLQYAEIIPSVDWARVAELFQSATQNIKSEGQSLLNFAGQTLPGTAAFAAGFWLAVRR